MTPPFLDNIFVFFQDLYEESKSTDVDPNFLYYYVVGLTIGILLITTFVWFPGKPLGIPYGKISSSNQEDTAKDVATDPTEKEEGSAKTTQDGSSDPNGVEWAGDKIPKEHLNKLQKKFKLTDEQMKQVMNKSKRQYKAGDTVEGGDSFHRQLNLLVYVIIISVLVYVVNRDYKNFISFWFARYFPVEARTLGLFVPEPRTTFV